MTRLDDPIEAVSELNNDGVRQRGSTRPVVWWAGLGSFFILLQLWVYGRWVLSDDLSTIRASTESMPTYTKVACVVSQVALGIGCAAVVAFVARQCFRERRVTVDAMIVIGSFTVAWQDQLLNFTRVGFLYNSYMLNFGTWVHQIPGWISPNGNRVPEGIFWGFPGYVATTIPAVAVIVPVMTAAKRRWPAMGKLGLFAVAAAVAALIDLVLELSFSRTGVYSYMVAVRELTLFPGHRYQFPIYAAVLWGLYWGFVAYLKYSVDDRGRTIVERGAEQLSGNQRCRTAVRTLAVVGVMNVAFLGYVAGLNVPNFYPDDVPKDIPSYLRNGVCGDGSQYECPGPGVPLPLRGS